jgi:hypothetical protein
VGWHCVHHQQLWPRPLGCRLGAVTVLLLLLLLLLLLQASFNQLWHSKPSS